MMRQQEAKAQAALSRWACARPDIGGSNKMEGIDVHFVTDGQLGI